ncbi:putative nucleotide-diphospho-sugar transferase [Algoriphagus aquimarinus]|uniref:putative nucleotide-diphospho-sugar transferase n=1 Tax=Algoriphagus aquimarinus TaxID=237018 RepID=UPI0030DA4DE4
MNRLSIASVRASNSGAKITLITDHLSFSILDKSLELLLNEVDEVMVQHTPDGTYAFRSRYLKTSLGTFIDGPFIFLDSDTFVRKNLDSVFDNEFDIAGCKNLNRDNVEDQINVRDLTILKGIGCDLSDRDYINSGVLFFAGTEKSKQFSEVWHQEWLKSYSISNEVFDQPALYSAISKFEINFKILADDFNSQVKTRFWFETFDFNSKGYSKLEWDSTIWHFYASIDEREITTEFEIEVNKLLVNKSLDQINIQRILKRNHPWRSSNFLDELVVDRVLKSSKINGILKLWISGNRMGAMKGWLLSKF